MIGLPLSAPVTLCPCASTGFAPLLAYTPFLHPLPLHEWWWVTLVPMALLISMAYKAVRMRSPRGLAYVKAVLVMSVQIVLAMVAIAVGMFLFVEKIVPLF